jgi:hypothetical protein
MIESRPVSKESGCVWWHEEPAGRVKPLESKKILMLGLAVIAAIGMAALKVNPDIYQSKPVPAISHPMSDIDIMLSHIRQAGRGYHMVDVLERAAAVRQYIDTEGAVREQSIAAPILKRIGGKVYLAGKNALSETVIWYVGDESVRLCKAGEGDLKVRDIALGWDPNSDNFTSHEVVGEFRNHIEYPVSELCQVPAELSEFTVASSQHTSIAGDL